ncbi:MAG TPA: ATP-dependent DNA helicase RecG [Nitrospira sp.]|nr:ATP-dependent DNA helicase RecG [Nitrospira sp.]
MPRPLLSLQSEALRAFLQRVARPIDFACRNAFAHLGTVRNLETFVAAQVRAALTELKFPRAIESDLLGLQHLFIGFHSALTPKQQRERLTQARTLLSHLQGTYLQLERNNEGGGEQTYRDVPGVHEGQPLWESSIQFVKGVGPKRALLLQRLGIETIEDALWNIPWRYEDRSKITCIKDVTPGMTATLSAEVVSVRATRSRVRRMSILDLTVDDGTGRLQAVLFNQPYLQDLVKLGTRLLLVGRIVTGQQGWLQLRIDVAHCEVIEQDTEVTLHAGRIVPIYHETKGWSSRQMRVLVRTVLDEYAARTSEILPLRVRAEHRLMPIPQALEEAHYPAGGTDLAALEQGRSAAHRRLAFEELFMLQLALANRRRRIREEHKPIRFDPHTPLLQRLSQLLPFKLTGAQERVLREIQADMVAARPMNRLLQGDVGSGKTLVALHAIIMACGSGCQAAVMVPTEILAEQHFANLKPMLEELGLQPTLVTGGHRYKGRAESLRQLQAGTAQVAIGTHALLQNDVQFSSLGLAVIDEQHKFGVLQRKTLMDKGYRPDILVMTATPIPRTLAMTVYGDLDVSIIDALPPGRRPVRTWLFSDSQRGRAWHIVREQLEQQRQVYFVYPLVEESEKLDLKAALQAAGTLQKDFSSYRVGLLHGRMSSPDKDRTMKAFKAGEIHILVATSVIEVGVDIPNATVMVIEHADRFGLAQLHQLRGRVGRSAHQAYCLLMAPAPRRGNAAERLHHGEEDVSLAQRRLEVMVKSNDGFLMAEEDLRLRGPGQWFGIRQWGLPEFRVANLLRDAELLQQARRAAFALIERDPHLKAPQHRLLRLAVERRWRMRLDLGSVS